MLHDLEAWVRDALLVVFVRHDLAISTGCGSPCEDWCDNKERLPLSLMLVERLSKNLNNFLSLVKVSAAHQVNDDAVSADDSLAKSLWLALTVQDLDLLIRAWDSVSISQDHGSRELVRFLAVTQSKMVVSHLLEDCVSNKTVDA